MRSRDSIITYSGHTFSPFRPDVEAIDIRDVAHALARIGRANGHFVEFYSVGQHCLDCAREALERGYGARQALICLLHDASEAYMSDITSPVKKQLRQYVALEDKLLDVIYQKYLPGGIRPREQRVMKEIDNTMLYYEFLHFTVEKLAEKEPKLVIEPCFTFSSFWSVEKQYLFMFDTLSRQIQEEELPRSWQTVGITYSDGMWHAAILQNDACSFVSSADLWELCNAYQDADAVLTDIPVGLPENGMDETLRPEAAIRRLLPGIRIAAVPCRQAVYAEHDSMAREENIRVLGRTVSPQQLALRSALREVDELLLEHNEWKNVLRQSHSELLRESRPLVLQQYKGQLAEKRGRTWEDALCLAVLGQMECRNGSETIPAEASIDMRGITMQIVVPHGIR